MHVYNDYYVVQGLCVLEVMVGWICSWHHQELTDLPSAISGKSLALSSVHPGEEMEIKELSFNMMHKQTYKMVIATRPKAHNQSN